MSKRIITYNVNGIRAALNKGFNRWLKEENPDIICLQETKAQPEQIDETVFEALGYHCYWYSAEKNGYSGVAIFTKQKPDSVKYGMGIKKYDSEGRVIQLNFGNVSLINVYIPSGTMGGERQDFKMEFLADFIRYITDIKIYRPELIISGDYNICHKPIDINHPERHLQSSGFLPEERAWFDGFIGSGLIDSFRFFDTSAEKYTWWSYRAGARHKNLGWRIDYHIVTELLRPSLKDAEILSKVAYSDHVPVVLEIDI